MKLYTRLNLEFVPSRPTRIPTLIVRVHPFSGSAVRVRYTESPRGSRKAVDCRQPRQTAHCSHAHCSLVGDTRPLAHPRLLLPRSRGLFLSSSRSLYLSLSLCPAAGSGTLGLAGRQLRNNNNAVRRCSMRVLCHLYADERPWNDELTIRRRRRRFCCYCCCDHLLRRARIRFATQLHSTSIFF